jgi:tetratricopeptide (TPR) repeat protein
MTEFIKRNVIVFVYFVLVLSTLLVYWQVRNFDFVNYDDKIYVYENPHVLNGLTRSGIIWAFTTNHSANWHPLIWMSHMLDCELFGKNPGRMHLVNVVFHIANTLLLFIIFNRTTKCIWHSAFVSALFAIHPMHVESVAWIAERKDVLSTLFWLLTMLTYVRYVGKPSIGRYLIAIVFFALGLMSKPMLVTLPFILILLDYWPLNRFLNSKFTILNSFIEKLPFLILSAISCVITYFVQRTDGAVMSIDHLSINDRVANAFLSYARYTGKLFVPRNLSVFYPLDINRFPYWQIVLFALLLLSISILVIYFGRKYRYLPVGWFWFVGTLVPVIGLVQVGSQAYADRYTYIPYIGIFIMLAWGLPEILSGWRYRKIALGMTASMTLIAVGTVAYRYTSVWNNSITLFSHAIEVTHNNAVAHNNLGGSYLDLKRYQDAMESLNQAIRINPGLTEAYANLGLVYERLGRWQEAIENYKQAISIKPNWAEAHCRLGAAYGKISSYQDALEMYKRAVEIDPALAEAHNGFGAAYLDLGRYQDALESCKHAIRIKPDYADAYYNLGQAFLGLGRYDEALVAFNRAIKINPYFAEAHYKIGFVYSKLGRSQEEIDSYKRAISIKPDYADAYYNLGVACAVLGRHQEAIDSFKQSIRIKPDYVEAHYNLGVTYLMTGDKVLALEEYKILKTLGSEQADQLYNLIRR